MRCRICNLGGNSKTFTVRETMLGYGDAFLYFQCDGCGCLQIAEFPQDIGRYYPVDYYSFSATSRDRVDNRVVRWFRRIRNRASAGGADPISRLARNLFPNRKLTSLVGTGATSGSRILDVGCGAGWRLYALREAGFVNTLGVDPFVAEEITYENGLRILKRTVQEVDGEWDVIMFHHSFEHIPDQVGTLKAVARLLGPGGTCLIRIPTVSSFAWEHYRECWYQIDAPRHCYLHSVKSMETVARLAGLSVQSVVYDSTIDQFRASELCRLGIPWVRGGKFPRRQVREWKRRSRVLNREGRGDQAVFYLRKADKECGSGGPSPV